MIDTALSVYVRAFRKRPALMIVVLAIYGAALATFLNIADREKSQVSDAKFRDAVASEIVRAAKSDAPVDRLADEVKVIFNSYDRKSKGKLNEYGLVAILEDAFSRSAMNENAGAEREKLLALIEQQKRKDPYHGLRFEQQMVIKSLERELSSSSSTSTELVEQIKEVVRRQNFELEELRKSTTWGIPIGIAGVVATIIFGLLTLAYPLIRRRDG